MKSMRELINLTEGRQGHNPEFDYKLTGRTKGAEAAGNYNKITATVKGRSSAAMTRLAKKFNEINQLNKRIKLLRDEANQEAKNQIQDIFSAEDAAYTRYVKTVSLGITMSKDIEQSSSDVIDVDRVAFINELFDVVDGKLLPVIKDLLAKHTHFETKIRVAQQGRLTVKIPESILSEGIWDKIKKYAHNIYNVIMQRLYAYDSAFDDIKMRYEATAES